MLEYVPASFKVVRHVRPKLACDRCDVIMQAPAPSRPIVRGLTGPGLMAQMLVAKYCDYLPLYRQSAIYARHGLTLSRSTLADWVAASSQLLRPLVAALQQYVTGGEKVHADDTPVPVLAPGQGKTKTGRLWTYVRDDRAAGLDAPAAVWFGYSPDRKGEHLHEFTIGGVRYGEPDPDYPEPNLRSEKRVRLDNALGDAQSLDYLYDFGDYWEHEVRLMEVATFNGPLASPWCLDGTNACPPEDVGGLPGYEHFLHVLSDRTHPEYDDMLLWHGKRFDPAAFDLNEVNQRLSQYRSNARRPWSDAYDRCGAGVRAGRVARRVFGGSCYRDPLVA